MIKIIIENLKFLNNIEKKKLFLLIFISVIILFIDILMAALVYPLIQQIINPGNEIIFGKISYLNKFTILDNELNTTLLILILIIIAIITKTIVYFLNIFFNKEHLLQLMKDYHKNYINNI